MSNPAPFTSPATVPATAAVDALKRLPTTNDPIIPAIKINNAVLNVLLVVHVKLVLGVL